MTENLPETIEAKQTALMQAVTVDDLCRQVALIQTAMKQVMRDGTHFGKIPGCGDKPSLFKPGAEQLGVLFRLIAQFDVDVRPFENGHREYAVTCKLTNPQGVLLGQGVGSCSTLESKYRWRNAERECPSCGKNAIFKSKKEGEGFYCWAKKGGCGATFCADDVRITAQSVGRVENPDIADVYNTVLKIAKKRAHVDAMLTTTAASDCFTQDIEDMPDYLRPQSGPPKVEVIPADELPERAPEYFEYDLHRVEDAEQREVLIAWATKVGCIYDPSQMRLKSKRQIKKLKAMEVYVPQGGESHV